MAAAVLPQLTIQEYLNTVFRPDVDYVDGVIEERNLGEYDHADLQGELNFIFRGHAAVWDIRAVPETRVQVSATRFRIPDVCVMPSAWQRTQIILQAPLLCIEVLSPEDRLPRMIARCKDYLAMGTAEVWIFDPKKRAAHRLSTDGAVEIKGPSLSLEGTAIILNLPALFAVLDR